MSALHMISLPVELGELRRLCALHGLGADEGRGLHHFLGETFGKGAVQPFRLMPGRNGAPLGSLYGYTLRDEPSLRRTAGETAPPENARLFDLARLAVRTMPETWREGRRLAFDIRVRPVRRLLNPLEASTRETRRAATNGRMKERIGKGAELDAYLVARLRAGAPESGGGPSREDVYRGWLAERLRGATLHEAATRMVACERARVLRGKGEAEACDVTFHGELTVADPAAFAEGLAAGLGRHKAYGYGMLLLRPARD